MKKFLKILIYIFFSFLLIVVNMVSFVYVLYNKEINQGKKDIDKFVKEELELDYPKNIGNYNSLKINEISPYLISGYVIIEDKDFYEHHGLNISSLARAFIKLIINFGEIKEGGSSITQQVIKNNILSQEKTFKRKFIEMFLAIYLEKKVTKNEILEYYCNTNYYANGCYGVENASRFYFDKHCKDLTLSEAAMLIGISNHPNMYNPITNYNNSIEKTKRILYRMYEVNYITKEEYEDACNKLPIIQNIY